MLHSIGVRLTAALLATLSLTSSTALAGDVSDAVARFRARHGASWRAYYDGGTGYVELLYGGATEVQFAPRTDGEWFELARAALLDAAETHGIDLATLVDDRALFLPLGQVGSTDKQTVRFRQVVEGVPVEHGFVNVLFDARGRMLSIQTHALPRPSGFDVVPVLSAEQGAALARADFAREFGLSATRIGDARLVIAQVETAETRRPVLCWRVDVFWEAADSEPEGRTCFVDARSGEVAMREHAVHHFDVSGVLRTKASPGLAPDTSSNPETSQALAYTTVSSGGVTATTDSSGAFTLVGVQAPATVTAGYRGTYNFIDNAAGASHVVDFNVVASSGSRLELNGAPTEHVTSQANVAIAVNRMRDWVRSVNPLDATADFVHRAFVNINSQCNAYFGGSSINFFHQAGPCVNTAYSTVIAHEDGHWLNVRYGTGNGPDGMGEGNADVFAMYLYDNALVGEGCCGVGCGIRSGLNTRSFCGDSNSGCYGEVHADGEVWMGAAWKVRRNLNNTLGDALGDATANALLMAWMNGFNQQKIRTAIELQWLTLDDDDGDLQNATPHFTAIDSAFREQGFPGVTLSPISISSVTQLPDVPTPAPSYSVDAAVVTTGPTTLTSVRLFHGLHGAGFSSVAMTSAGGANYVGAFSAANSNERVLYYIEGVDSAGNIVRYPTSGANDPLFFNVGPTVELFHDSFDFDLAWTIDSVNLTGGEWLRGDPVGTTVFNSEAQPEDDNPAGVGVSCLFTGQGQQIDLNDAADVDGGPTRATSPSLDLAGRIVELHYAYWLYSSMNDDELVVELSNNGGATWTVARTHSLSSSAWREAKIDLNSFFAPSAAVRVRFSVADANNDSVTEAAIDDVRFVALGGAGVAPPTVFCSPKINSLLCVPSIGVSGSPSASSPLPFVIGSSQLVSQRTGLLFYGYGAHSAPLQGGTLCCRPPILRTPTQSTGGSTGLPDCTGSLLYDMNARIRAGTDPSLAPGATVAAQYYYRDPQDTFGIGLTDAVTFQVGP